MNEFEHMITVKAGGENAIALFLGLFLLVLAFFILLVSISTIEKTKSREVMDSLTSTFADLIVPVTDPTEFVSMQGEILAPEAFQERISGVFSTAVAVDRIKIIQPGKAMRIEMQAHELFEDGSATIRSSRLDLLDRVVTSLSANPKNIRYEMAFLIGSPPDGQTGLPTRQTLEISRAGNFARALIERGAPENSISAGIRDGLASDVIIHFYARDEELARLNFVQEEVMKGLSYDDMPSSASETKPLPSNVIELKPPKPGYELQGEGGRP